MPTAFRHCGFLTIAVCMLTVSVSALTVSSEISLDGVPLTSEAPQFPAGSVLNVNITIANTGAEAITALDLETQLPQDWIFLDTSGTSLPQLVPDAGSPGTIHFLWYDLPSFPTQFSFRVQTPADKAGAVTLRHQALYRTQGAELTSPQVNDTVESIVPDCTPLITATGPQGVWVISEADFPVTLSAVLGPPFSSNACLPAEISVEYEANGKWLGSSIDAANNYSIDATLPAGIPYTIIARAIDTANGTQAEDSWTLDLRSGTDTNANGYPDSPFDDLQTEGDQWIFQSPDGGLFLRMLRFEPKDLTLSETVTLSTDNLDGTAGKTQLTETRSVLQSGEHGILILAVADAYHLADLVADGTEAGIRSTLPTRLVPGYRFALAAGLIQASDGTVSLMDAEWLAQYPLQLSMDGFALEPRLQETFLESPVALQGNDPTNLGFIPSGTGWITHQTVKTSLTSGTLLAFINEAGIYVPYKGDPPVLISNPPSGSTLSASLTYPPQRTRIMTAMIQNTGKGQVVGSIAVEKQPFSLLGSSTFNLGPGARRSVMMLFKPTAQGHFEGTVTITHDAGSPIQLQLSGDAVKRGVSSGCNGEDAEIPSANSDMALVAGVAIALFLFGRYRIRPVS